MAGTGLSALVTLGDALAGEGLGLGLGVGGRGLGLDIGLGLAGMKDAKQVLGMEDNGQACSCNRSAGLTPLVVNSATATSDLQVLREREILGIKVVSKQEMLATKP